MTQTTDPRSPWQIAEGRYGLPQAFRIGQRVRFSQSSMMPDWASDWNGVELVITGAFSTKRGAIEYWVNEVGSRDGDSTDVKEEWLEDATNG